MPNFASVTIIGHLGRNPETRTTQAGKVIFNATVAVNTGYGENIRTTWWNVVAFGKTAETLERFNLTKGAAIGFQGEPSLREWEDKEGNKRQTLELAASTFILMEKKADRQDAPAPTVSAAKKPVADAPFDDEIPF